MTDRIRSVRHEAAPNCGSFEVRFPDDRPPRYFYWDNLPSRRLRPDILTNEQGLEQAKAFACQISNAALGNLAGRWRCGERDVAAEFEAHRKLIEAMASARSTKHQQGRKPVWSRSADVKTRIKTPIRKTFRRSDTTFASDEAWFQKKLNNHQLRARSF
jgi:hypothetical protein